MLVIFLANRKSFKHDQTSAAERGWFRTWMDLTAAGTGGLAHALHLAHAQLKPPEAPDCRVRPP